jgi:hypothetical protein
LTNSLRIDGSIGIEDPIEIKQIIDKNNFLIIFKKRTKVLAGEQTFSRVFCLLFIVQYSINLDIFQNVQNQDQIQHLKKVKKKKKREYIW